MQEDFQQHGASLLEKLERSANMKFHFALLSRKKRSAWSCATGTAWLTATGLGAFSRANSVIPRRSEKS